MDTADIKIPPNRKRFPALFIAGLLFTFVVVLLLRAGINDYYGNIGSRIVDSIILCIPLFYTSVGLVDYLKVMLDGSTGLYITSQGVDDNLSTLSCGMIGWNEITGVDVQKIVSVNVLVIKVANPDDVIRRLPLLKRRQARQWANRLGSPIVISERRIDYDIFAVKNIIANRIA